MQTPVPHLYLIALGTNFWSFYRSIFHSTDVQTVPFLGALWADCKLQDMQSPKLLVPASSHKVLSTDVKLCCTRKATEVTLKYFLPCQTINLSATAMLLTWTWVHCEKNYS